MRGRRYRSSAAASASCSRTSSFCRARRSRRRWLRAPRHRSFREEAARRPSARSALVGFRSDADTSRSALGGEKQRTAIARALVSRPKILIADEPTGNLDPVTSWEIIKLLVRVNELGTTMVMATHNAEIVNALRRRVVHLDHGMVVRDEREGQYAA